MKYQPRKIVSVEDGKELKQLYNQHVLAARIRMMSGGRDSYWTYISLEIARLSPT